ncbi:hypothetical protein [Leptolyngbya ohadii]|uniref:hypothetical protein n=1 Tax=Leptolyngbya ohadii TaxID=1962290 RepID=UPI000B59AC73|nr:hypothetical protein [Leptolyngbya ohadii]
MLPKQTPRSANLTQGRQAMRRQIIALNHPIVWSGAAVLVLSGLFLAEYWQSQFGNNSSNLNATNSAGQDNPLLQGSSNQGFNPSANSGSLPDLPLPVLPGEAVSQSPVPIDPALRSPTQSPQNKPQPSSRTVRSASRPENDSSLSLYNPMGVPMPRAWENFANPAQLPGDDRRAATPTANPTANSTANPTANSPAVSPLQSALDRMKSPVNPSANLPQSPQAPNVGQGNPANSSLGNGIPPTGAIEPRAMGTGQPNSNSVIPQSSYTPTPQTTGYTMPPAFRTPDNSSPYSSPTASPIASPEMPSTLPSAPAPMPQSNLGQTTQSGSFGAIGGREINSFSNP